MFLLGERAGVVAFWPIDFEAESGKFGDAWHHAAGARGGVVRALRRPKVAA
jgi:hypothetical protein